MSGDGCDRKGRIADYRAAFEALQWPALIGTTLVDLRRLIMHLSRIPCLGVLLIAISAPAAPAEPNLAEKKAYADPAEAEKTIDFQVQGEYVGGVKSEKGEEGRIGAQVIALGEGKFRAVIYLGGLPGAGAKMKDPQPVQIEGALGGDKAVFTNDKGSIVIRDGMLTAYDPEGKQGWAISKTRRESPTLGAKPPPGAVVLFDGTKQTFEKSWRKGARMSDDGLLMEGATSEAAFGDFKLHIEFRLPFQPYARGQARGNSGIYMQARHEVQMLDSFGLEGKNNECGGIYTVKDPDVNMCLPPLSWQTYDVEFTAARFDSDGKKTAHARVTVHHNNVKVHDNAEVPNRTRASPQDEGPAPGPIYLQNHGNPVRYRNIWVLPVTD